VHLSLLPKLYYLGNNDINVIKLFAMVIYSHSMVILSFCVSCRIFFHLATLHWLKISPTLSTSLTTWSHGSRLQSWLPTHTNFEITGSLQLSVSFYIIQLFNHRLLESGKTKLSAWPLLTLPVNADIHQSTDPRWS
jgi:uncharacterized membrane protein YjjP (DUF1212 family)